MGVSLKGRILYKELYRMINSGNLVWKPLIEDSLNHITERGNYILISIGGEYNTLKGNFLITKTDRPSYSTLKSGGQFHPLKEYILVNTR